MKKQQRKLSLHKETIRGLQLAGVGGGFTTVYTCFSCPTTNPCAVSRAFTNCAYCNGGTQWQTDCTQ